MSVVDAAFERPLKTEEEAATPLAGGLLGNGYQCGMLWGATLAAGAETYRRLGPGPQAEATAVMTAQRLVDAFRARARHVDCSDITEVEWKTATKGQMVRFVARGGPIGCFRLAADYAPLAFNAANAALAEPPSAAPVPPVSCAAQLAQAMGASDLHTVMAAGLAGGIGLCGAACGALGAAIWLTGMARPEAGGTLDYSNPAYTRLVERFLEASDYEFECAAIVGRQFENVADHAAYLRQGGCSRIIAALAGQEG